MVVIGVVGGDWRTKWNTKARDPVWGPTGPLFSRAITTGKVSKVLALPLLLVISKSSNQQKKI